MDAPSPELLEFFLPLHRAFEPRRRVLVEARRRSLLLAHAGQEPGYLPASEATEGSWTVTVPAWAADQRNQITGPADNAKLLVAMTNTADPGCMPDGEDSITTDWANVRAAHRNVTAAIKGTLAHEGRTIKPSAQVMFYRPRGLHLDETNVLPGETVCASLFDLAAVFHATAAERRAAAKDPARQAKLCFYIPKTESAEEAAWFSEVLTSMEEAIGVPAGSTKVMFLIESLPAAYQIEEILFAARRHVIGLNLGRWDYMASLLHFKLADPGWILPDRNTIPHDVPFFQNLRRRIVECCHRRGALAIGGMTALFPDRTDAAVNARAQEKLAQDKKNEAALGFDGAWTGHPDQHQGAISQFPAPNQLGVRHPDFRKPDLTPSPMGLGAVTDAGTRDAIRTCVEYRFGVLCGLGARMIKGYDAKGALIGNFMEDLATDRIYRLMIAQRVRHGVHSAETVARWFDEETRRILDVNKPESATADKYRRASEWSQQMIKEATAPSPRASRPGSIPPRSSPRCTPRTRRPIPPTSCAPSSRRSSRTGSRTPRTASSTPPAPTTR
ncbi:MAG: aldolase/citrate lyase family protein [Elusimicrobiota bacterium]|nr:MAG: aldolase/citrate lyase family protein [Elusimicrobiota bacterium]